MWARIAAVAAGIWLMAAPAILGYGDPAQSNDQIVGALAASAATIAAAEVTRSWRWLGLPFGAWLLLVPWMLGYDDTAATLNSTALGLVFAVLAPLGGQVRGRFGGGWSALRNGSSDDDMGHDAPTRAATL